MDMNKSAYTIADQIALLKQRGMIFKDEAQACNRLQNISYYRLKDYWWDMQSDTTLHLFHPGACFEDVLDRYDFDRKLRLILFGGIERIEIAVRTSLIYHLSIAYGGLWYLNPALFETAPKIKNGISKTTHLLILLTNCKRNLPEVRNFLSKTINAAVRDNLPMHGRYWK